MKSSKMDLILRLRSSKLVRRTMRPLLKFRVHLMKRNYLKSDAPKKLSKFKNRYCDKRCFIIGNGPSLTGEDLKRLKNEYTFGVNRIFVMSKKLDWHPTFYVAVDEDFIKSEWENIDKLKCDYCFLKGDAVAKGFGKSYYPIFIDSNVPIDKASYKKSEISIDITKGFSLSYSVTCYCIELAIYMGFKTIYLLGVDHNFPKIVDEKGNTVINPSIKEHFSGGGYKDGCVAFYKDAVTSCYEAYKNYADQNGIKIINLTRGGNLEVFVRDNFDGIVK